MGATTAQALEEQASRIEAFGPDLLHLNSGANDIMRLRPAWGQIEENLRAMYEWARGTGAQLSVVTFVIPAIPGFSDRVKRLNEISRALAMQYGAAVAECKDHALNDRLNLLSQDGIHFATSGQAIIASIMIETLGSGAGDD